MAKVKINRSSWDSESSGITTYSTIYTIDKGIFVELRELKDEFGNPYSDETTNGFKVFATGGKYVEASDYNEASRTALDEINRLVGVSNE